MAKYKVDKDLCISCGYCVNTCPDVYRFDSDDKAEAYAESDLEEAQTACDNCPVAAIAKVK